MKLAPRPLPKYNIGKQIQSATAIRHEIADDDSSSSSDRPTNDKKKAIQKRRTRKERKLREAQVFNGGKWSRKERLEFLRGLRKFGPGKWKKIQTILKTRYVYSRYILFYLHGLLLLQQRYLIYIDAASPALPLQTADPTFRSRATARKFYKEWKLEKTSTSISKVPKPQEMSLLLRSQQQPSRTKTTVTARLLPLLRLILRHPTEKKATRRLLWCRKFLGRRPMRMDKKGQLIGKATIRQQQQQQQQQLLGRPTLKPVPIHSSSTTIKSSFKASPAPGQCPRSVLMKPPSFLPCSTWQTQSSYRIVSPQHQDLRWSKLSRSLLWPNQSDFIQRWR